MQYLQWILDEIGGLRQFPRLAVALVLCAAAASWWTSRWHYTGQISNLRSQIDLLQTEVDVRTNTISNLRSEVEQLQTELEAGPGTLLGPLPRYSLGGSNILVYNSDERWTRQDTARNVELDWGSLDDLEADVVLRLRADGTPPGWVQARLINVTDGEVVATTQRHSGPAMVVRSRLPRARGVKTYAMDVRGQSAGLEGEIELVRP
jgi:hypothetical protein